MASAEETGYTQICFSDSDRKRDIEVGLYHSTEVSQASKAATGANFTALPYTKSTSKWADENSYIVLKFKPDVTGDIIESEESNVFFGIILKNKKTGELTKKTLTLDNMVGFTAAGTVDSPALAATFWQVATYQVPAGYMATMDGTSKYHAYIGDDS